MSARSATAFASETVAERSARAARSERAERDTAAIERITDSGGQRLRGRMRRVEVYLRKLSTELGAPLAPHAAATILAGGKRLRPLLLLVAADASTPGGEREEALVRAASAVELLHSATLVHDDVLDGARLRRGRPTVVATAGRRAATATGDVLFARAFAELARNRDRAQLRALSDASSALAAGELLQREDAFASDISVERYLQRCELKTAALFEAACRLGALVGRLDGLGDALGEFARRIGLAFQLLDDVLDVSGPVAHTGKPRGTDLLEGTVTLPLIVARRTDPALAASDLKSLRGPDDAEALCERIVGTGALAQARSWALDLVRQASAALPESLPGSTAELLRLVADAVVERYH